MNKKILIITEKPAVAKVIAQVLGQTGRDGQTIFCGNYTITPCAGHLLEMMDMDTYIKENHENPNKYWRKEDLPVYPEQWQMKVDKEKIKLFNEIKKHLKTTELVIHAGDPDREGQNIVDSLLQYLKYTGPVERYLSAAITEPAARKALSSLKPNANYKLQNEACLARQRFDWLIGMNLTRLYTVTSKSKVAVGRVKTPTLQLVIDRYNKVKNFKSIDYFTVERKTDELTFKVIIKPDHLEDDKYLTDKNLADIYAYDKNDQPIVIQEIKSKRKKNKPPIGYDKTAITKEITSTTKYTSDEVTKALQNLYEKGITTYPRTKVRFLPKDQYQESKSIASNLCNLMNLGDDLKSIIAKSPDTGSIWNQTLFEGDNPEAHHAIVPTSVQPDLNSLSTIEKLIYIILSKNLIAQFLPVNEYDETEITAKQADYELYNISKITVNEGWKFLYKKTEEKEDGEEKFSSIDSKSLSKNKELTYKDSVIKSGKTKPPMLYDDGSLEDAMSKIHTRCEGLKDEEIALLKHVAGIGTPATQTGIINTLISDKYMERTGKYLTPTKKGLQINSQLPALLTKPSLTIKVEELLMLIEQGKESIDTVLALAKSFINTELNRLDSETMNVLNENTIPSEKHKCPTCGKGLIYRNKGKGSKPWWGCSGFPGCKKTYGDKGGKPIYSSK